MKVLLNSREIEVDVSGISSFSIFYNELNQNLNQNGMLTQKLFINGKEIDLNVLPDYDLENIDKIEIIAEDINVVVVNTLTEMLEYINKFISVVNELSKQIDSVDFNDLVNTIKKVNTGLLWIFKGIKNCEMTIGKNYSDIMINNKSLKDTVIEYSDTLNNFETSLQNPDKDEVKNFFLKVLPSILQNAVNVIKHLFDEYKRNHFSNKELQTRVDYFIDEFTKRPETYEKIGELIQTGSENEGIDIFKDEIIFFEEWIAFLKKLERTFHNITMQMLVKGKSIFEYNKDFMVKLKELSEAFEKKDLILISDIIEYEINDYIEVYVQFLKDIKNSILGSNKE